MTQEQQQKIVELTTKLVGTPYIFGEQEKDSVQSFDCSSFIQYLYSQVNIELPRSSILQAIDEHGTEVETPEIGDLLFMRGTRGYYRDSAFNGKELYIGHVGIYLGDGKIAHAQAHKEPFGVIIETITELEANPKYKINLIKRF